MTLFTESGGDLSSRIDEASRIVSMLLQKTDQMTPHEAQFVEKMFGATNVSPKQLFWLRDLNEKY